MHALEHLLALDRQVEAALPETLLEFAPSKLRLAEVGQVERVLHRQVDRIGSTSESHLVPRELARIVRLLGEVGRTSLELAESGLGCAVIDDERLPGLVNDLRLAEPPLELGRLDGGSATHLRLLEPPRAPVEVHGLRAEDCAGALNRRGV